MKKSGHQYYLDGYGYSVGIKLHGQIGKRYIYWTSHNQQYSRPYKIPYDPNSPGQQKIRDLYRKAFQSWRSLSDQEKNFYKSKEPITPTMSGYNYYVRQYINTYK